MKRTWNPEEVKEAVLAAYQLGCCVREQEGGLKIGNDRLDQIARTLNEKIEKYNRPPPKKRGNEAASGNKTEAEKTLPQRNHQPQKHRRTLQRKTNRQKYGSRYSNNVT